MAQQQLTHLDQVLELPPGQEADGTAEAVLITQLCS